MAMWMVRAQRGGLLYDDFKENGRVAMGWAPLGSYDQYPTREALADGVARKWPENNEQSHRMAANASFPQ